jgi:hypothetical protein
MRSKSPFIIMRYNDDASISYYTKKGTWKENIGNGYAIADINSWLNSGNAWRCITKLTRAKKIPFKELFVWSIDGLAPFTEADAMSFACLLSVTSDSGEIDVLAHEALEEKSNQIMDLEETLTELRVAGMSGSEDD